MKASFFVVADRVGKPGYLSADDLRRLQEAGMEIGTHGMHHRSWRGLTDAELEEEIVGAQRSLEAVLPDSDRVSRVPVRSVRPARAPRTAQRANVIGVLE